MDSTQQITLKKIGPVCTKLEDPRWFEIDVEDHFTLASWKLYSYLG